jgi:hypothetical protein
MVTEEEIRRRNRVKMEQGRSREILEMVPQAPAVDWDAKAQSFVPYKEWRFEFGNLPGVPSNVAPTIRIVAPGVSATEHPHFVIFPDPSWQPPEHVVHGKDLGDGQRWGLPSTGEMTMSFAISNWDVPKTDADRELWPAFYNKLLALQLDRNTKACAQKILEGKNLMIVSSVESFGLLVAAAVIHELDLLLRTSPEEPGRTPFCTQNRLVVWQATGFARLANDLYGHIHPTFRAYLKRTYKEKP